MTLLANAVCVLARMAKKARTSLWCAWQIGMFNQQSNVFVNNGSFILNENLYRSQTKSDNFSTIFQINTDITATDKEHTQT